MTVDPGLVLFVLVMLLAGGLTAFGVACYNSGYIAATEVERRRNLLNKP